MNLLSILLYAMVLLPGRSVWFHGDIKFHLQLSMQANDAKGVAACMEDAITFEYQNTSATKNKAGVEKALIGFFAKYKCKSFKIDNQGYFNNRTRHMEGIYESINKHKFQVYFEAVYDEKEADYHLSRMMIEKIGEN